MKRVIKSSYDIPRVNIPGFSYAGTHRDNEDGMYALYLSEDKEYSISLFDTISGRWGWGLVKENPEYDPSLDKGELYDMDWGGVGSVQEAANNAYNAYLHYVEGTPYNANDVKYGYVDDIRKAQEMRNQ